MTALAATPQLADLGGLPFIDDRFAARRLLAITAAVRYHAARQRGLAGPVPAQETEAWLGPARTLALSTSCTPMPARPLTATRRQQVTRTLAALTDMMPPWRKLLALPVRYALLYPAHGAISASSRDWPQHVLLADEAFATNRELAEQVVHELAHQWLYLIEDIWPLQHPGAATLTLPSGTRDRTPAEVLGAAHVAAALIRLYRQHATDWAADRIQALTGYGTGCLTLAAAAKANLTDTGILFAHRLKEAF